MKTKHTPGPWFVDDDCWIRSESTAGVVIIPDSCTMPDLQLISASPDLLEALEFILAEIPETKGFVQHSDDCVRKLKSAINKARGES